LVVGTNLRAVRPVLWGPTHYRDGEVASDRDKVALTPSEHETFRVVLGFVNFLCICTRPNIACAINVINMRQTAPTHMKQLKRLLRYLNGTRPMCITYGRPSRDNAGDINQGALILTLGGWHDHHTITIWVGGHA
jgi:hypothetical protein